MSADLKAHSGERLAWFKTMLGPWLSTPVGLICLFGFGLVIRLVIAPHVGFYGDLRWFSQWTLRLVDVGPASFYAPGYFADYPPGYLYVLLITGKIARLFGQDPGAYLILKLPAIVADLALAWVVGELAVRVTPPEIARRLPVRVIGVAFVLLNPAVIALSAIWGQVDVIPVLLVVAALLLLVTGAHRLRRDAVAIALFALAVSMKPQSGLVLPAVGLGLLWRYILRHRASSDRRRGVLGLGALAVVGFAVWSLSGIPFGLHPGELLDFYRRSASTYPLTSVWAFNFWGLIAPLKPDASTTETASPASVLGVPALYIGVLLFAVGALLLLRRAYSRLVRGGNEARTLLFAAAAVSLFGYAVLTRMHERYLFLSLACLAPFFAIRRLRASTVILSALFMLNLYFPFVLYNQQWNDYPVPVWTRTLRIEPLYTWLYGGVGGGTLQKRLLSLAVVLLCLWVCSRGERWISESHRGTEPLSDYDAKQSGGLTSWRPL